MGININNFEVGPCPHCGGTGHIPDGVYDVTAEGIRVVATSANSADSLAKLRQLLEEAHSKHLSAEETAAAIEREVPEFRPLAQLARRLKGVPFLTWVALLMAAVSIIQAEIADRHIAEIEGKVDQIYQHVVAEAARPGRGPSSVASAPRSEAPRVGRNDPCPCGSGKKYKRCHGR